MSRMLMVYQFHVNESFELVTFHCLFCWLIHISLPLFVDSLFMLEIFNLYVKILSGCIYWTEETVLEVWSYGATICWFFFFSPLYQTSFIFLYVVSVSLGKIGNVWTFREYAEEIFNTYYKNCSLWMFFDRAGSVIIDNTGKVFCLRHLVVPEKDFGNIYFVLFHSWAIS